MHTRRLIAFLLGAWLGGSLLVAFLTNENLRVVDHVLATPSPKISKMLETAGHDDLRTLLRFQAAEQNRLWTGYWEVAQMVLGLAIFLVLLFGTSERRLVLTPPLAMSAVVAIMHWVLTPDMIDLGRSVDFAPAYQVRQELARMHLIQNAYLGMEILKFALGLALLGYLLVSKRSRRSYVRKQVHSVHHPDHGHIDG